MPEPDEGRLVRVGVMAFVRQGDDLLFERRTVDREDRHYWGLVAGGKQAGETTVEAVEREVREETGLRFRPSRVVGLVDHQSLYDDDTSWTVVGFEGRADGRPDEDREPEKRAALDWCPPDDPPRPLHPTTERMLETYRTDCLHLGLR